MDEQLAFQEMVQVAKKNEVTPLREAAERKMHEYVWNRLTPDMQTLNGSLEAMPEDRREELINRVISHDAGRLSHAPATRFYEHLDEIAADMNNETLENLVASEIIRNHATGADGQVIQSYLQYREFDAFVTRYLDSGRVMTKTEEKLLQNAAMLGFAKVEEDKVEDKSEKKFVRSLAMFTMQQGLSRRHESQEVSDLVKKHAKAGLEEQRDKIKEGYEHYAAESGRDLYGAVRNTLKGTKDFAERAPDEFKKVYFDTYRAGKGQIKFNPVGLEAGRDEQ